MPLAIRLSAVEPWVDCTRIFSAAVDGGFGGGGTHVGERLGLGLRDLGLRHLGAARDELLDLALRLGGETLGLGPRALDDRHRFLLGLVAASSDTARARPAPRRAGDAPRRAPAGCGRCGESSAASAIFGTPNIDEHAHENHKGDGDPEFGIFEHRRAFQRLSASSTAARDRVLRRRRADQPLDDRAGGLGRDAAHVGHRGGLGRGDALLGLGELGVAACPRGPCGSPRPAALSLSRVSLRDRLRAAARVGERFLVGRDGGVRTGPSGAGFGEVAVDAVAPLLDDRRRCAAARPATISR